MSTAAAAARRLASALEAENAALSQLNFQAVGGLLAEKSAALAGLAGMQPGPDEAALGRLLGRLMADNRQLLERALLVQGRVIGTIARAAPRAMAAQPRFYGRDGGVAVPRALPAMALSARA